MSERQLTRRDALKLAGASIVTLVVGGACKLSEAINDVSSVPRGAEATPTVEPWPKGALYNYGVIAESELPGNIDLNKFENVILIGSRAEPTEINNEAGLGSIYSRKADDGSTLLGQINIEDISSEGLKIIQFEPIEGFDNGDLTMHAEFASNTESGKRDFIISENQVIVVTRGDNKTQIIVRPVNLSNIKNTKIPEVRWRYYPEVVGGIEVPDK